VVKTWASCGVVHRGWRVTAKGSCDASQTCHDAGSRLVTGRIVPDMPPMPFLLFFVSSSTAETRKEERREKRGKGGW
jgi:hypothetical protein